MIKGYYPAVVTEDVWRAARAATLSRHRRSGKPSVRAVNLFTSLVYMKNEVVVFRSKDGVKYYCPVDQSHPGVKLEHVERCLLYWLGEIKLKLGDEGSGSRSFGRKRRSLIRPSKSWRPTFGSIRNWCPCSPPWPSGRMS